MAATFYDDGPPSIHQRSEVEHGLSVDHIGFCPPLRTALGPGEAPAAATEPVGHLTVVDLAEHLTRTVRPSDDGEPGGETHAGSQVELRPRTGPRLSRRTPSANNSCSSTTPAVLDDHVRVETFTNAETSPTCPAVHEDPTGAWCRSLTLRTLGLSTASARIAERYGSALRVVGLAFPFGRVWMMGRAVGVAVVVMSSLFGCGFT